MKKAEGKNSRQQIAEFQIQKSRTIVRLFSAVSEGFILLQLLLGGLLT